MQQPRPTVRTERLWQSLMQTARFGANEKGGLARLACSDDDRAVREWFTRECESLGCRVQVDACGNMFATLSGRRTDLLPIAMGSHLDTQPTGGKLDGILGVLSGIEVIRTLLDSGYRTNAPLMVINWTNEEGSRFPPAMLCSGVYAGVFSVEYAYTRTDRAGLQFGDELRRIGYLGPTEPGSVKFGALFELHIEQGPILEAESREIGVVTGVQGMRWYEVTLKGRTSHTGTTPMNLRKDALLGAAKSIDIVNQIGRDNVPGVGTVGLIECRPNSRNTVPGEVFFTVDLRHPNDAVLDAMETRFRAELAGVATTSGLEFEERQIWKSPAVAFDPTLIESVRRGAEQAGLSHREITSGAGHDAGYIARVAPTSMIFIPSIGGISHNEAESSTPEQCAQGCQVLMNAVIEYDRRLADRV